MKPIIVDMKDISDSTEVYDSKPNRFMVYTIYIVLLTLFIAVVWMSVSKIDIVVKSNGIFKTSVGSYEISSEVTGKVKETYVSDGQYVNEGDLLCIIDIDTFSDTIVDYKNKLEEAKYRLEILDAYEKSLYYGMQELEKCSENPYYDEFVNKRELLNINVVLNATNTDGQSVLYQESIDSITKSIEHYQEKITQLNKVKHCISAHKNTISSSNIYYYSVVNSYLATYNYTCSEYDNKINEIQKQIDEYNKKIEVFEKEENNILSGDNMVIDGPVHLSVIIKYQKRRGNRGVSDRRKRSFENLSK